jgi:hypothetical protein
MMTRDDEELIHDGTYHKPDASTLNLHSSVRARFLDLNLWLNHNLPRDRPRELSLAITKAEEAQAWAHAAVARSRVL